MLENKLADLSELLDREVGRLRDMTGTNLAGLRHLINQAEEKKDVQMEIICALDKMYIGTNL